MILSFSSVSWAMNQAPPPAADPVGRTDNLSVESLSAEAPLYAAIDLGTNNCRLLIATPSLSGFRVIESYSRIVRLGEGLSQSGRLADGAMGRAMAALRICAEKIKRRRTVRVKAIATQACRSASNGAEFVARVAKETGIRLQVISPLEEAHLSVAGCLNLFDRESLAALVIDVGGGSTELSWVDLTDKALEVRARDFVPSALPIRAWVSIPVGVVSLSERFPERLEDGEAWFRAMVEDVKVRVSAFPNAEPMRPIFESGRAHLV
jgi:exopolyphosphatase/guanosine-5'-triphosphate,3'-diphosphate pyrophosphatase